MKASAVQIDGTWCDVYKAPFTDPSKQSKRDRLALVRDNGGQLHTIREGELRMQANLLRPVYSNGKLLVDDAGKKVNGRKRHVLVDTLGLVLAVLVTTAAVQDRDGARLLLQGLPGCCKWIYIAMTRIMLNRLA